MIRKIIIYLSIFAICAGCLVLPVSASGYEGELIDLLPAATYNIRYGSMDWFQSDYPSGNSSNFTNVSIKWDNHIKSVKLKSIYINIRSSSAISTVRISEDDETNLPYATYLGMYDSLYQYKFDLTDYTFSVFSLRIFFGSITNVEFIVESVYGLKYDAIPISQMNHNVYYVDFMHVDGTSETQPVQRYVEGGNVSIPYTMNLKRSVWPTSANEWMYTMNIFEFYPASFKSIGKMSILLFSSDIHNATISLNVGGVKEVIPCDIARMDVATKWPGLTSEVYNYWQNSFYEVTFDLSDYDLTGTNACIYMYWEGEPTFYLGSDMYWYCQIVGAWYYPVSTPVPWYQTMWSWISGGFDRVVDALQTLAGDPTGGAMQDAANDMKDQAEELDDANEVMNNVSRPDVDPDQLLGDSLNFSPGGMMVLSSLTNNPIITSLLVAVCSFALVGYIFFGKR